MTSQSLSPISVMLCSALAFIAFDLLVSLYDVVPVAMRITTVYHACLFGLAFAGAVDPDRFRRLHRWPRFSVVLSGMIACMGSVAIVLRLGIYYWIGWLAAFFSILPLFLISLGLCRVVDQMVPCLRRPH